MVWPFAVDAQQPSIPVVGFVNSSTAQAQVLVAAAYRRGLEESGFVEGKNVLIESRWADGQYNRLPELIGDLIKRNVAVLMAGGHVRYWHLADIGKCAAATATLLTYATTMCAFAKAACPAYSAPRKNLHAFAEEINA